MDRKVNNKEVLAKVETNKLLTQNQKDVVDNSWTQNEE